MHWGERYQGYLAELFFTRLFHQFISLNQPQHIAVVPFLKLKLPIFLQHLNSMESFL